MAEVPHIFDANARALRRARAERIPGESFLVLEAAAGVADRAGAANRTFQSAVDVGSAPSASRVTKTLAANWTLAPIPASEVLDLPAQNFDLAISVLSLHAVNDLPGLLIQIRRALKPDGLFVGALFAGDTLTELRESLASGEEEISGGISPRVSPFADVRDLGGLMQRAGFNLPVADTEKTTVRYRAFETLIADLRAAGETNVLVNRSRNPLRRDVLDASLLHYKSQHAEVDGRLRATFEIAYLTGWAPHESQQKPLRPGSAKVRLADALGTQEINAGDKTGR